MGAEPSEDVVQSFCGLSGLPRSNAIRWLKAHSNNPDSAAMAWIDGGQADLPPPPRNDNAYDGSLFHTERDGTMPRSQMEASGLSDRVPPTRPSSRVDKPMYGPENNPNISQPSDYERDLQRAKEMSLSESQTLSAQETGVTYDDHYFGPPTQTSYNTDQWAMTVPETNAQEILLNPEPPDRMRAPGAPAFLKPTSNSNNLAPFLAILHSIPLAREALLNRGKLINDYGRNPEWWDGAPIRALRVVNVDDQGPERTSEDLLYETQRVMAFLDDTERAYGNADALVGLPSLERTAEGIINSFLLCWRRASEAFSNEASMSDIFTSRGVVRPRGSSTPNVDQDIYVLPLEIRAGSNLYKGFSLYELIDEFIARNSVEADTFLDQLGEIFTFEISNLTTTKQNEGIAIPPIWYADRYLESSLNILSQIQSERENAQKLTHNLEARAALLSVSPKPGSSAGLDAGQLMTVVNKHLRARLSDAESADSVEGKARLENILDQITRVFEQVLSQLKDISDTQDSIPERLLQASNKLKAPSEDPQLSPTHRYVLKGVILRSTTFYVLEPCSSDEEANESLSSSVPHHQWWRIEYNTTSLNPVLTTKVPEKEVLDAASTDSKNVFLIYASDKALAHVNEPLPTQLQNFVKADNRTFQEELKNHQTQKEDEMSWQQTPQDWSNPHQTWDNSPPNPTNWAEATGFPAALSPQKRKAKEAADEDSDMEVEHDAHSPDMMASDEEDEGDFISSDSSPLDPYPFDRGGSQFDPPPVQQRPLRPLEPKPPAQPPAMGLNGRLPATLRQNSSGDQEMQEIKR